MISASDTHGRALRAWVLACLNLDDDSQPIDPAPFGEASVIWSDRDHPRPGDLFCRLSEVAHVPIGRTEQIPRVVGESPDPVDRQVVHREISEWTVGIQVVSRLDSGDPRLSMTAGVLLRRVWARYMSETTQAMRDIGCAPTRRSPIRQLGRVARGAYWETRAAFDLTSIVGSYIVERPGWIESIAGEGTLDPLPPEPFDVDSTP